MNYRDHIEINLNVRFGKPGVKGTRITLYDILGWLAAGMSNDEIIVDFPKLTLQDILACLAYSADRERKVKVTV